MSKELIEDIITKFSGKTFSNQKEAEEYLREALTEVYEAGKKDALREVHDEMTKFTKGFGYKKPL